MRIALSLLLVVLLQACASTPEKPPTNAYVDMQRFPGREWTVAVMDLHYQELTEKGYSGGAIYGSGGKDAGRVIAGLLAGELNTLINVSVVERGQLGTLTREQELQMSGSVDANSAVELGKVLGADAVVVGDVSEYVAWTSIGLSGSTVSYTMRMIDAQTGRILANGSVSRVKSFSSAFDNAQELTQMLVDEFRKFQ